MNSSDRKRIVVGQHETLVNTEFWACFNNQIQVIRQNNLLLIHLHCWLLKNNYFTPFSYNFEDEGD